MGRLGRWWRRFIYGDERTLEEIVADQAAGYRYTYAQALDQLDRIERQHRHTQPEFWGGGKRPQWHGVYPWELNQ